MDVSFTQDMIDFLHTHLPDPVFFSLGPVTIHWYGVWIVSGFLLGLFIALRLADQYALERKVLYDLCFYGLLFGIIGDRVYYVIYAWEYYQNHLVDIPKIWEGGLAIHGGIIAGLIVLLIFAKYSKTRAAWEAQARFKTLSLPYSNTRAWIAFFWFLADLAVVILISGLMLGRFGNYFNQELFGMPTDLPWGIPIEESFRPPVYADASYFHPTFFYESLGDAAILIILVFLHLRRLQYLRARPSDTPASKKNPLFFAWGSIALIGLMLYSMVRFLNELLRVDYSPLFFGIRWAQIVSAVMILLMAVLLLRRRSGSEH